MSVNHKQAYAGAVPTETLREVLTDLRACDGIRGVVLASEDGLEVEALTEPDQSAEKLAAMSSALSALCIAASEEAQVGACRESIIEAGGGRLLTMAVRYRGADCVLLVVSAGNVPLGKVLWATRGAVAALNRIQ